MRPLRTRVSRQCHLWLQLISIKRNKAQPVPAQCQCRGLSQNSSCRCAQSMQQETGWCATAQRTTRAQYQCHLWLQAHLHQTQHSVITQGGLSQTRLRADAGPINATRRQAWCATAQRTTRAQCQCHLWLQAHLHQTQIQTQTSPLLHSVSTQGGLSQTRLRADAGPINATRSAGVQPHKVYGCSCHHLCPSCPR